MKIFFCTTNQGKINEIKEYFKGSRFTVVTPKDLNLDLKVIEDGETLGENALIKVRAAHALLPDHWAMSDDTSLDIDALGGEPGIYAARWLREGAPIEETRDYCLERMEGIKNRSATFRCVIALKSPQGEELTFGGELEGWMREVPSIAFRPNMPYSSLFMAKGYEKTLAEMTIEEENRISHRGQALDLAKEFLDTRV